MGGQTGGESQVQKPQPRHRIRFNQAYGKRKGGIAPMSEPVIAGEYTLNIDVPGEIKELKVLRDLELEEEGKGKLRSLLRI